MKFNKKIAFSLIEVIIATSIISITVFWIYKLISENTKIINNSWDYLQANSLFPIIEECLDNIWFENFWTWTYVFTLSGWLNECSTWSLDEEVNIDNLNYQLMWIAEDKTSEYIVWNIVIIPNSINSINKKYIQKK